MPPAGANRWQGFNQPSIITQADSVKFTENPMSYDEAYDKEVEVEIGLQSAGFGVWQA